MSPSLVVGGSGIDPAGAVFTGLEYTDTVTFGVPVTKQGLGVAITSQGFTDVDGIIGFGRVSLRLDGSSVPLMKLRAAEDLTAGTVALSGQVPTFMQNAAAQKKIPANILGRVLTPCFRGAC